MNGLVSLALVIVLLVREYQHDKHIKEIILATRPVQPKSEPKPTEVAGEHPLALMTDDEECLIEDVERFRIDVERYENTIRTG